MSNKKKKARSKGAIHTPKSGDNTKQATLMSPLLRIIKPSFIRTGVSYQLKRGGKGNGGFDI